MAGGGVNKKVSAASARSHARKAKQNSSSYLPSGTFLTVLIVLFVGILTWGYQAFLPPPPKICGSLGGPLVTATRIKLRDGRHLAYMEFGVWRDAAKFKIIFIHGFDCSRKDAVIATHLSPEIYEELGIYIVSFDRPGYGESDPHPQRTLKSLALDIEELADQLELGSKFYVVGFSMGGQLTWTCLKYIPHRLAGATLLTPVANYWWPGFPANLSAEAYKLQLPQDQWALRVFHYIPWLTYWWNTQKWFPSSSVIARDVRLFSKQDKEAVGDDSKLPRQQGEYESLHRDAMIGFATWEFDPMDLKNPFSNNEGSVHIWQGDEDNLVPVILQRYIAQKLPWIHYHELQGSGHMFPLVHGIVDKIVKTMLMGEQQS